MLRTAGGLADPFRPQSRYRETKIPTEKHGKDTKDGGVRSSQGHRHAYQLAILCRNQEKYEESNNLGPDHPETLRALDNLSIMC